MSENCDYPEATAEDAHIYMEMCAALLARLGGDVFIDEVELPMKPFSIARRFVVSGEKRGLEIKLINRGDFSA